VSQLDVNDLHASIEGKEILKGVDLSVKQGEIHAVATTSVFRFNDDVTITISHEGEGAVVNVRSHSRVGKGDFGTNARRIRRFQAELAKRV